MPYLVAAVVLIGTVALVNLLLTMGVVRRLREHSARLQAGAGAPSIEMPDSVAVGERIGDFASTTVDSRRVGRDTFAGRTLIGFLKPGCQPCDEQLPEFQRLAADMPGGRDSVLAVVVGSEAEAGPLVAQLAPVGRVVVESPAGPVNQAFKVFGYPTYFVVDETGTVRGGASRVDQVPVPEAA